MNDWCSLMYGACCDYGWVEMRWIKNKRYLYDVRNKRHPLDVRDKRHHHDVREWRYPSDVRDEYP